jgi:hypothetical protein
LIDYRGVPFGLVWFGLVGFRNCGHVRKFSFQKFFRVSAIEVLVAQLSRDLPHEAASFGYLEQLEVELLLQGLDSWLVGWLGNRCWLLAFNHFDPKTRIFAISLSLKAATLKVFFLSRNNIVNCRLFSSFFPSMLMTWCQTHEVK